jgi:hypothetical protein
LNLECGKARNRVGFFKADTVLASIQHSFVAMQREERSRPFGDAKTFALQTDLEYVLLLK